MPHSIPPAEKAQAELHAHMNLMLRQVQPQVAELIIGEIHQALFQQRLEHHTDREASIIKTKWQTGLASLAAATATVIMQCPAKSRLLQASIFGHLLIENIKNGQMLEAVTHAAGEATQADVNEAQDEAKH